jgi:hypothetical protein
MASSGVSGQAHNRNLAIFLHTFEVEDHQRQLLLGGQLTDLYIRKELACTRHVVRQVQCCRTLRQEVFHLQQPDDSFGTCLYIKRRDLAHTVTLGCNGVTTERHARTDDQGWVFLQLRDQQLTSNRHEIDQA